tara:strand:- start:684 stop:1169 length:486 start_codon:yes stop_codon:yes gene_type:complete
MTTEIEHDFNKFVIEEQRMEKERMEYHLKKDSGLWVKSKDLVNRSFTISSNDDYLFDFMTKHVMDDDTFLKDVERVHFHCKKSKSTVKLTGPEARHFVENYKMPSTLPTNSYIYSMMFGNPDITEYNVYLYVYFKDIIVDFPNNWRDRDTDNLFTIIPRNP